MLKSLNDIYKRACSNNAFQRLVVAAADDIYVLKAVEKTIKLGLIAPIFVGNQEKISALIEEHQLNLPQATFIPASSDQDSANLAVELINSSEADLLMKGLLSTRILMKAVLKKLNGAPESRFLSHLALFESPFVPRLFGLTDAAINISPNVDTKIRIIQNSVSALHRLGIACPRVAMLAAIEKVNPRMQATIDADCIVHQHLVEPIAHCKIEGPLSLDIALSEQAAKHKSVIGQVAGNADLLIAPEITSGNIFYKSLTYLGGAQTAGVLLGASIPIIITSRADSVESKYNSIVLSTLLCK